MHSPLNLRRTPLHEAHAAAGARFVGFGGWEMPLQYSSFVAEHQAVRSQVGMFDVSHMGKFELRGKDSLAALQYLVPSNLERLAPGRAQYTVLLNEKAGILDDIIAYRHAGDRWTIVVNAATTAQDWDWMTAHCAAYGDCTLEDRSADLILLAIQGPAAIATVQAILGSGAGNLAALPRFGHVEIPILGALGWLARTGYTGEDGCEVMVAPAIGRELWERLLGAGVVPCGLGCRDTLRLEAGMHLYGQDMDAETTPLEASLAWVVHWDEKGDFIGRSRLEIQRIEGVQRRLVGLELTGRNIARQGYAIRDRDRAVGIVTSGTFSPTLGKPIAMGYVATALAHRGQQLSVEIRGKDSPAIVTQRPFYRSH